MEPAYEGFEETKRRYPSADLFCIPVLNTAVNLAELGSLAGRINAGEFEGKAPGTLYFVGPEGSSAEFLGRLVFVYRPEGWNTEFNPTTGRYQEVAYAQTGAPLYQSVDFAPLAVLKTD